MKGCRRILLACCFGASLTACSLFDEKQQEATCEEDANCPEALDALRKNALRKNASDTNTHPKDACENDAECSYNGDCASARCVCNSPWSGAHCQQLILGPVDKSVYGYRQEFPFTTSWGGSVKYDHISQKYIMLVSEYVEDCANWGWNSTVALATAEAPEGPYEKKFTLFGVMSHEAMLAKGPAEEWVAYFTAVEREGQRPRWGAEGYESSEVCTRRDLDSACECPGDPDKGSKDPTWMSFSSTPLDSESWSTPVKIFDPGNDFIDQFADGSRAESIDANLNGVIKADGSFVGLFRTWQCVGDLVAPWSERLKGANTESCFSVPHALRATDWKDPSSYKIEPKKRDLIWLFEDEFVVSPQERLALGIEDPMVYIDRRSPEVFHAIFHEMFVPNDNVSHAYSTDGVEWTYTGVVFETSAKTNMPMAIFTDGDQAGLACERPQLLIEDGIPTHIIIGGIPTGLAEDSAFTAESTMNLEEQVDETGWPGGATMVIPLASKEHGFNDR